MSEEDLQKRDGWTDGPTLTNNYSFLINDPPPASSSFEPTRSGKGGLIGWERPEQLNLLI